MSTSVAGRVVRPRLGYDSFAHLTATPVATGGITSEGVLFDGPLTDVEVGDVWWFATSADAADEARRKNLSALRTTATTDPSLENVSALVRALATYQLGDGI